MEGMPRLTGADRTTPNFWMTRQCNSAKAVCLGMAQGREERPGEREGRKEGVDQGGVIGTWTQVPCCVPLEGVPHSLSTDIRKKHNRRDRIILNLSSTWFASSLRAKKQKISIYSSPHT